MRYYIVYDDSGVILRTGGCQDPSLQAQDNEFVIEGQADDLTQRVVNGRVVDKLTQQLSHPALALIGVPFGVDNLIIGTNLTIEGEGVYQQVALDSPLETITFNDAGEYILLFQVTGYLDYKVVINAS